MRIISGEFRRRVLETPPDDRVTRPIPDFVKESLFSILRGHCEGANVFDGFAGTGAIGLEAISRGAARCTFVEQDRKIGQILRTNIDNLGVQSRCDLMIGDALGAGALARAPRPLHLAFLDPPYPLVQDAVGFKRVMAQMAGLVKLLDESGYVILRTPWPLQHEVWPEGTVPVPAEKSRSKFAGKKSKRKGSTDDWRKRRREFEGRLDVPDAKRTGAASRGGSGSSRAPREEEAEWFEPDEMHLLEVEPETSEEVAEGDVQQAKPTLVDVNMAVVGAVGPETHEYRGMAVHLYMKKK